MNIFKKLLIISFGFITHTYAANDALNNAVKAGNLNNVKGLLKKGVTKDDIQSALFVSGSIENKLKADKTTSAKKNAEKDMQAKIKNELVAAKKQAK